LADRRAGEYLRYTSNNERQARGYFLKALVKYYEKDFDEVLEYCSRAKALHHSDDIITRIHEVYWLIGLSDIATHNLDKARSEIDRMQQIITYSNTSVTNYHTNILKFWLHLRICMAAENKDLTKMFEGIEKFDGILKDKIKDQTSPFDLAFFNNSFAELFIDPKLNRLDLAEIRLQKALEYNKNFALAHYNLYRLYEKRGLMQKSETEFKIFKKLWSNADPGVKKLYGITD
jgi:tetratricopeptide (TPR) repeat protein